MGPDAVYELMNKNPAFALATVDQGAPRVRGMLLYSAGAEGIIFHSGAFKDLHKQLLADPRVELYFFDPKTFVEVRVNATVEIVDDNAFKTEIANHPSRAFVKKWMESGNLEEFFKMFMVYRLKNPKACAWTMETNFAPKVWFDL